MPAARDNTKGKHYRIYETLFADIMSGRYADGEKIPNEIQLAETYGVSRPTVAKAIRILEKRNLVYRKSGAGTYVSMPDAISKQKIGLLMPRLSIAPRQYAHFVTLGSMIVSEISRRANTSRHVLLLNDLPYGNENEVITQAHQICRQLIDLEVKGVIFMPFEFSSENQDVNESIAAKISESGITVTLIDRDIKNGNNRSDFDIVCIDNEQAAYDITKHLVMTGSKKIEFVTTWIDVTSITRRIRGFKNALEESGLNFSRNNVHRFPFLPFMEHDKSIEQQAVQNFLKDIKADALVCANDRLASVVIDYALKAGIKVPEDLKVVGFDDEPFGAYLPVPLTTMRQPAAALGAEAIRLLISRSEEPDIVPREVMLKAELVIRSSCGFDSEKNVNFVQGLNGREIV